MKLLERCGIHKLTSTIEVLINMSCALSVLRLYLAKCVISFTQNSPNLFLYHSDERRINSPLLVNFAFQHLIWIFSHFSSVIQIFLTNLFSPDSRWSQSQQQNQLKKMKKNMKFYSEKI